MSESLEHLACPSHCCPIHGCKYGYDDCPVVTRQVSPLYPANNGCESCEMEVNVNTWNPIETAPDNGILLLWESGKVPYVGFREIHGDGWSEIVNMWAITPKCHPTHWTQLPDPPASNRRE